ncbi:2,5-didehydrogluconate reductase [Cunninghamella echinulata]|nr:2,5-didehydrogluconate reductase [Cunninghamella echinulata]
MSDLVSVSSTIKLNDGNSIPCVGFGVYQSEAGFETENAVLCALKDGYRHIDTASCYYNEESVGLAIKKSGIPRDQIFVTTKLWDTDHGYEKTKQALQTSLDKLGLEYVDLYLIHSPLPGKELRLASWKALEELKEAGKIKSIGVSNYGVHHLKELLDNCTVKPVINQIEITPYLRRDDIETYCQEHDIIIETFSPLTMGLKLNEKELIDIGKQYSKSSAQVLIRWAIQRGYIPLPKSVTPNRIKSNSELFDFTLSEKDMTTLNSLNEDFVTEWNPTTCP